LQEKSNCRLRASKFFIEKMDFDARREQAES
jgi:hypothetical protein